jgi:hypothetical protein
MSYSDNTTIDRDSIVSAHPIIKSAAHWFWWIVALSLINTILIHSGSQTSFAIGLGFTLTVDTLLVGMLPVALLVDFFILGFFFAMGYFARKGHRWAFLIGGIVYAADAIIFLVFQDYVAILLHAWALISFWTGGMALHRAIKQARIEKQTISESTPAIPTTAETPPPIPPL